MRIHALVVDDDPSCIDTLKTCLESYPSIQVEGAVNSAEEALSFLSEHKVDLLFLDIEMKGMSGLDLAHLIEDKFPKLMIIFVTGFPGFALDGYEVHPVDFLTKPINIQRLDKAIKKVRELMFNEREETNPQIGINVTGGIRMIHVNEIKYIEKKGRKVFVVDEQNEKFDTRDSIKKLEEIFEEYNFYRPHQSFLVPVNRIQSITPDSYSRTYMILLSDHTTKIPLSRNNYSELKKILQHEANMITIQ